MKDAALLGFVIQQPFSSTQRMKLIRGLLLEKSSMVLCSTYDDRPSKLFDGIHHARIAISISQKSLKAKQSKVYVTPYEKWYKEERECLFQLLPYSVSKQHETLGCFPKISSSIESEIIDKIIACEHKFSDLISDKKTEHNIYYKITGVGHWFTITARPPKFLRQGKESSSTRENLISFSDKKTRDKALAVLNSSLFYWFYQVRTNCRDFNPSDYKTFPIPSSLNKEDLSRLSNELCGALDSSSSYINVNHSQTGEIQIEQFKPREQNPSLTKSIAS
ncbi:MAG: hypothetical protein HC878_08460 [Leptolyngbyaceae cyanobacterium SL_5_14]|nr:hypothetical protein [Leptolyngbyaceae cyanobacterium SL_5_14]